jgi:hypothetical protein
MTGVSGVPIGERDISRPNDSSCLRLSRASTFQKSRRVKDGDGRDKPGHHRWMG